MRVTALLDGDIFIFESAFSGETTFDWDGDGQTVKDSDIDRAINNLEARIKTVCEAAEADRYIVCLGDPSRRYWRHRVYPEYKQNRTGSVPPELLGELRKYVQLTMPNVWFRHLEADDVMGVLMTGDLLKGGKVCVTKDKDLKQIPGTHLNHSKVSGGKYEVMVLNGAYWHMYQTLVGDACDGYTGCPGIGPVKANRILGEAVDLWISENRSHDLRGYLWDGVLAAFKARGLKKADAMKMARVSKILQAEDYNVETGKVKLWSPS